MACVEYGTPYACFIVDKRYNKPTPQGSARTLQWKLGDPMPDLLRERGVSVRPTGVWVWDSEEDWFGHEISTV